MGLMMAAVLRDFEMLEREDVVRAYGVRVRSRGIFRTESKAIKGIRRNVTFPTIAGREPAGGFRAHGRRSAIRLLERGVIGTEKIISRRFALNKGMVNP
jgi:hypothetical protein